MPTVGSKLLQSKLGETLDYLGRVGLDDFYVGDMAKTHGDFLAKAGSPLLFEDLKKFKAEIQTPLSINTSVGQLFNLGPPTQGMSSLAILGIYDRIKTEACDDFDFIHRLVEATKQAFITRNLELGDPADMKVDPADLISDSYLDSSATNISLNEAADWPEIAKKAIQSGWVQWIGRNRCEFYSKYFLGIWQWLDLPRNRSSFPKSGAGFSLTAGPNCLAPGKNHSIP